MKTDAIVRVLLFWIFVFLVIKNAKRMNRINPFANDGIKNKKIKLVLLAIGLLACAIHIIGRLILKLDGSGVQS